MIIICFKLYKKYTNNINCFSLFLNLVRLKFHQRLFVLLGLLDDIQTISCRFYPLLMLLRFEILNVKALKLLKEDLLFLKLKVPSPLKSPLIPFDVAFILLNKINSFKIKLHKFLQYLIFFSILLKVNF